MNHFLVWATVAMNGTMHFLNFFMYLLCMGGVLSSVSPEIGVNWTPFGVLDLFLLPLPPAIRWHLSCTLSSIGTRCLDLRYTLALLSIHLRNKGSVLSASAPEISCVNRILFGTQVPFLIHLSPGFLWHLSATRTSRGARHLYCSYIILMFAIILDVWGCTQCVGAANRRKVGVFLG